MSNNNPFKQTAAAFGSAYSWTREQSRERAKQASNAEVTAISSLNNDKSSMDEAVFYLRIVLWIATIFTAACGFFFYRKFLSEWMPENFALVFAVLLALVTEVGKVLLTGYFLRSVFFGWISNTGWTGLGFWLVIGLISAGFFVWSVRVSTQGAEAFATQTADERTKGPEISAKITAATAELDKQISEAQEAQKRAQLTGTKRSRLTADKTADRLSVLTADREKIAADVRAEHEKGEGKREVRLAKVADWTLRWGGYSEGVCLLCLLGIGLCVRRLFDENSAMIAERQAGAEGAQAADFR